MSLLPARYTLDVWQGSTFRKTITVLTGDADSPPQDLTSYSAVMNVRTVVGGSVIYTLSTANGKITLNGVAGTIALFIPEADTENFDQWGGPGLYDLTITAPGPGDTTTVLWGTIRIHGTIKALGA